MAADSVAGLVLPRPAPAQSCSTCPSEAPAHAAQGYCPACGAPWQRCVACGRTVNPLWRVCPRDGHAIDRLDTPTRRTRRKFAQLQPSIVRMPHASVRIAPIAYAGSVWTLSTLGELSRVSPAHRDPAIVASFGPDFGAAPFGVITESAHGRPLLAAVGRRQLALIDPATHRVSDEPCLSPALPANDSFAPLDDRREAALAAHGGMLAGLTLKGDAVSLALWNTSAGPAEELFIAPFPEKRIAGPFVLGGRFCAYGSRNFYALHGTELQTWKLPAAFSPLNPDDFELLRRPWGRAPFVACPTYVYLPGTLNGEQALLLAEMDAGRPRFSALPLGLCDAYRPAASGSLLITGERRLKHVVRTRMMPTAGDGDTSLVAHAAAMTGDTVFAFCRTVGRQVELRIYPNGIERVSLPGEPVIADVFDFDRFVTVTYLLGEELQIASWPLA